MPAARYAKRPKLTPTPRREINASLHPQIDASLKAARQCSQRLTPLEQCLQDEMRILERIYYKGVNQHRMALFWRRVQEVRRLGKRVLEVRVLGLLDDLRYSFYGAEGSERNPKILKGAWTQVPDAKFLTFTHERLMGLVELVTTAKERFMKAFHSLSLMMQTGAFLQSILTLTAIVSRLNTTMEELDTSLRSFTISLEVLLEALGHKKKIKVMTLIAPDVTNPNQSADDRRRILRPEREREDITTDETTPIELEDLGSTVLRRKRPGKSANTVTRRIPHQASSNIMSLGTGTALSRQSTFWQEDSVAPTMEIDQEPLPLPLHMPVPAPVPLPESSSIIITAPQAPSASASTAPKSESNFPTTSNQAEKAGGAGATAAAVVVVPSEETAKVKKKKKTRRRRDEIDEIFQSLV